MKDVKPTNPKDGAAVSRLDLSLIPSPALAYLALALTEGDLKYGGFNYRAKGVRASVYLAALERHTERYESGEWEDDKTKVPHLASMMACCAILIDGHETGMLTDDRPPKFNMSELLERFEKIVKHMQALYPNKPKRYTQKKERTKTV